jgi:hypothetical protein
MKHEREREFDTSYFHNPHSPGAKLLPLHHVAEGDGVNGVEGAIGSGSGNISLLSLQSSNSFVYSMFLHHLIMKLPEGSFI